MIEIHTLGWRFDHPVRDLDAEPPNASVYCRAYVDGVEIPDVIRARTYHRNDFAMTTLTLGGAVQIANHTWESWRALPDYLDPQLRLAQALRLLRDTSEEGGYVQNVCKRALLEAGVPDPPEEDHP